jgi:hypothetical protein
MTVNVYTEALYGVAVRDGADLLLLLTVRRAPPGDVYVNIPYQQDPEYKPHASYHASGQRHAKSCNRKFHVVRRQAPDQNFRGSEVVECLAIGRGKHRAINLSCQLSEYHDVFEIEANDLPQDGRLAVDLAEPGSAAFVPFPGAEIVRQKSFEDAVPWILVTLWSLS